MDINRLKMYYDWPIAIKSIFYSIIFIIVFYAGYHLDLSRFYESRDEQKQKEIDLKQQLESVFQKIAASENDIAQLPHLTSQLETLHTKIIRHAELPNLLKDILKLGTTNHLYFSLFDPGDENTKTLYPNLPIKIIAIGTYHQTSSFISQLANMPAIVAVGPLTMVKDIQPGVASNMVTTEILLNVYYLPKQKKS